MASANSERLPVSRVVHCDWGTRPEKCWMARADWDGASYTTGAPEPVGELAAFFARIRHGLSDADRVLVGFDFPIGLPAAYADRLGIVDFLAVLPELGTGRWSEFYRKCRTAGEIGLHRPFYPVSCKKKGEVRKDHLAQALGIAIEDLARECEKPTCARGRACELFWTLGANQVGSAAIRGWRDLLAAAMRCPVGYLGFWPFQGPLRALLEGHATVIAETYPAEAYGHIGFPPRWKGKGDQTLRRMRRQDLHTWERNRPVRFDDGSTRAIDNGFGSGRDGEDRFDAFVGLCSMLDVVLGRRREGPADCRRLRVEGWILGQDHKPRHILEPGTR